MKKHENCKHFRKHNCKEYCSNPDNGIIKTDNNGTIKLFSVIDQETTYCSGWENSKLK